MNKTVRFAVLLLMFTAVVTACEKQKISNVPIRTSAPSQTITLTITPILPIDTPSEQATKTLSPIPTKKPTSTNTALPSFTPLPTMDKRGILGLIDDNGGCQLPCWWGIEPGRTSSQQALQFLENIPANISPDGDSGSFDVDGKVRFESAYQIKYALPGSSQQGKMQMIIWDDIVTRISINSETTQYRFTLDQLLQKIGKPSQIFIEAKYDAMGYTIPFRLILYYPNQRFFAIYYVEAEDLGKIIRACPAKAAPGLILWAPEYKIETRLALEMLGPDSRPGLQNLKDATGLSIDDFYTIFSKAGFRDCIESPMGFWENLK